MTFEENLKAILIPNAIQRWYHIQRELRRGEREIHLVRFLANKTKTSIDVGANRGIWANIMAEYSNRVLAFEPNPKMYDLLKKYSRPPIEVSNLALSNISGETTLMVPRGTRGYSNQGATLSKIKIGNGPYGETPVTMARLDDLDLGHVGFIKIDVEGHELEVLDGGRKTIQKSRPNLIVEIEEKHTNRPIKDILNQICGYGYQAFACQDGAITHVEYIDLARHHSAPQSRADYIFNWIFLPI
jgi:FkbM family methyltransferase